MGKKFDSFLTLKVLKLFYRKVINKEIVRKERSSYENQFLNLTFNKNQNRII
jgi:hypothetical protein